jgi:urease accessory protein
MYDAGFRSDVSGLQRARGELRVRVAERHGASRLDRLFQAGCLKARLPRACVPGWADIVTLNTSGGVASGDRLAGTFEIAAGARATIASQAAERYYRAPTGGGPSLVHMYLSAGEHAAVEWLPQETILFDGSTLDRSLDVELAASSWFVGIESLVFGRAAMGERMRTGWVRDAVRVHRAGRLIWHDTTRLDGGIDGLLRRPAVANGTGAMAGLVHVAPAAERRVDAVRAALDGVPVESGVSGWDGLLVARILAPAAAALREALTAALGALRDTRPLPRVWQC